jgi:AcrR family transcriptional regulator
MNVFWRKGYEGTSLTDLTEAMGIARPSLYAAFGNKESLFLRVLDLYAREKLGYVREALAAPTARGFVEGLLNGVLTAQSSDCDPRGCLAVMTTMQGSAEVKPIREEVFARHAIGHAAFVARFERAKAESDLAPSADSEGLARLVAAMAQGIIQASSGATPAELQALVNSALAMWPTQ